MSVQPRLVVSHYAGRRLSMTPVSAPYYVASVEVGNTTTKCILTVTDPDTGMTDITGKCVRMTSSVRKPGNGEIVFGKTLGGTPLTREALAELVCGTVLEAVSSCGLSVSDLCFVSRSTGIISDPASDGIGEIIRALADGCLMAGVPASRMRGAFSQNDLPPDLRRYSNLNKVYFDGAVAGTMSPLSGGEAVVPNEMEGELAGAGLKEAALHTDIDFRNPCIVIDMGTTLSGRVICSGDFPAASSDALTDPHPDLHQNLYPDLHQDPYHPASGRRHLISTPYGRTVGNFCGYAGAVADALVSRIDPEEKTALELLGSGVSVEPVSFFSRLRNRSYFSSACREISSLLSIGLVPPGRSTIGPFRINETAASDAGLSLIACDVGQDGSGLSDLAGIGLSVAEDKGMPLLSLLVDEVMSDIVIRLIGCVLEENVLSGEDAEKLVFGITGRSGISGDKPAMILRKAEKELGIKHAGTKFVFADDGLARGAAVMGRCINSLGCPKKPLGGNSGCGCIMKQRMKYQNRE
ncbi:MAG: DUF2114 family protein [Methanosarcinaceae archaeon]|nr:DUF2114 family protein [Methanosarcinaceae archaeon]